MGRFVAGRNFLGVGMDDSRSAGATSSETGDNMPLLDLGDRTVLDLAHGGEDVVCAVLDNGGVSCWGTCPRARGETARTVS